MKHLNEVMDLFLYKSMGLTECNLLEGLSVSWEKSEDEMLYRQTLNVQMETELTTRQLCSLAAISMDLELNAIVFRKALQVLKETDNVILETYCLRYSEDEELSQALKSVLINFRRKTIIEEVLNVLALQRFVFSEDESEMMDTCVQFHLNNIYSLIKESPDLLMEYKEDLFELSKVITVQNEFMKKIVLLCTRPVKRNSALCNYFRMLNVTADKLLLCNLIDANKYVNKSTSLARIYFNYYQQKMESPNDWSGIAKENVTQHLSFIFGQIKNEHKKAVRIANFNNYKWFYENVNVFDPLLFLVNVNDPLSIHRLEILTEEHRKEVLVKSLNYQGAERVSREILTEYSNEIENCLLRLNTKEHKIIWDKCFEQGIILKKSVYYLEWLLTLSFLKISKMISEENDLKYFIKLLNRDSLKWDYQEFVKMLWSKATYTEKMMILESADCERITWSEEIAPECTLIRSFLDNELSVDFLDHGIKNVEDLLQFSEFPETIQYGLQLSGFPLDLANEVYYLLASAKDNLGVNILETFTVSEITEMLYYFDEKGFCLSDTLFLACLRFGKDWIKNLQQYLIRIYGDYNRIEEFSDIIFSDDIFYFEGAACLEEEKDRLLFSYDFECDDFTQLRKLKESVSIESYVQVLRYFEWCKNTSDLTLLIEQSPEFFEDLLNIEANIEHVIFCKLRKKELFLQYLSEHEISSDHDTWLINDYTFLRDCIDVDVLDESGVEALQCHALYDETFQYNLDTLKYLGTRVLSKLLEFKSKLPEDQFLKLCRRVHGKRDLRVVELNLQFKPLEWFLEFENCIDMLTYNYPWEADETESALLSDFIIKNNVKNKMCLKTFLFSGEVAALCNKMQLSNTERLQNYLKILQFTNVNFLSYRGFSGNTAKLFMLLRSYVLDTHVEVMKSIYSDKFLQDAIEWIVKKITKFSIKDLKNVSLTDFDLASINEVYCTYVNGELSLLGKNEDSLQEFKDLEYPMYVTAADGDIYRVKIQPSFGDEIKIGDNSYYFPIEVDMTLTRIAV